MKDNQTAETPSGESPPITREEQAARFEAFLIALCEYECDALSSNGRTTDSESVYRGSNPCKATYRKPPLTE